MLQETWLSPRLSSRLLVFPGYTVTRADRPDGRGYGGVAILSRSGIQLTVLKTPGPSDQHCKLESLWCHIKWDRHQLVLASLYRPPRRSQAALDSDLEELDKQFKFSLMNYPQCPIVLAGDLNCNMLHGNDSAGSVKFRDFLHRYDLTQHVTSPTFLSGSLLDLVITNSSQGRRHGFLSGGSNRRQGGQPTPKYPKNRKNTGFWPLHSRIWGGRPARFSKVRGSGPPRPPPPRRRRP